MNYETYRIIFIAAAAASGLMLLTAVVLFFVLKIPSVIGELTGRTARKAIEGIRNQTEQGGAQERGRKLSASGRLQGKVTKKLETENPKGKDAKNTQKLAEEPKKHGKGRASAPETTLLAPETTILAPETTILTPETTILTPESNETTILAPSAGETAQLSASRPSFPSEPTPQPAPQPAGSGFVIEYEITYVHSNEYIA